MSLKYNKYIILKTFICFTLLILNSQNTEAQKNITPAFADRETYKLYAEQNWDHLIDIGNKSLELGYDYFYMRLRIGIAYYENKNYESAKQHFQKALEFNSRSELANEYLYFCYFLTGKNEEARKLSNSFSKKLLKKMKLIHASKIDFINAEAALKATDKNYLDSEGNKYYETANYLQFGVKHYINNKYALFHAATLFKQGTSLGKVNQWQYYLQASIPLKNNFLFAPAIHLINTKFTGNSNNSSLTDSHTNFVGSLSLRKSIRKIDLSIGSTFSKISDINQFNHFGTISYAPFGNSKLVIGTTEYLHTTDDYTTTNISHAPFVYLQPTKLTSIKLSYLKNENFNIIEDNGYLVNNSYDLTETRFSTLINFNISNRTSLYGMYQNEKKYHELDAFNYNYSLFLIGVKIFH